MPECGKVLASLSLSGSLAVVVLLLLRPLLRGRVSWRWQYYVWLIAVFRLLLPLSPEASPVGALFRGAEVPAAVQAAVRHAPKSDAASPEAGTAVNPGSPVPPEAPGGPRPDSESSALPPLAEALLLLWLLGALILLAWRVTSCRAFSRCLRAGCREVEDPALLDQLARAGEELGLQRPVELYENPLAASPMLLGLFRPCVVLPSAAVSGEAFRHTVLHELTHCKRRDLLYKWLVQAAVCVHWFNPLVWLMAREIDRACELACDEAVLRLLEPEERRAYGDTLLRALETGGGYRAVRGSVSLGENAEFLKERLIAIMNFKQPSGRAALLSLVLAAALTTGAAAAGAYTGPAKRSAATGDGKELTAVSGRADPAVPTENLRLRSAVLAKQFYEDGDIAGFSVAISFLSRKEQETWLERCYEDGNAAFFSLLVNFLDWDEEALDAWIARAAGKNAALLSILLEAAGRDGERNALEEQMEARQLEEYRAAGITKEGRAYYYQGNMVRVFQDRRSDASFVTLDMNPLGKLDIKVERGADGTIKSVREMTEAEVTEIFGDWKDPEEEADGGAELPPGQGEAGIPNSRRMTREELPAAVRTAMDQCAVRTWYVIRSEGRQYLYCNGFPWQYAWQPLWEDGAWSVEIQPLKKLDYGYLLLSFPGNASLNVTLEGEAVPLTDIRA